MSTRTTRRPSAIIEARAAAEATLARLGGYPALGHNRRNLRHVFPTDDHAYLIVEVRVGPQAASIEVDPIMARRSPTESAWFMVRREVPLDRLVDTLRDLVREELAQQCRNRAEGGPLYTGDDEAVPACPECGHRMHFERSVAGRASVPCLHLSAEQVTA